MHYGICANVQSREDLHCIISETIWKYIFFRLFYKTTYIIDCMFFKCCAPAVFYFYLIIPYFIYLLIFQYLQATF